MDRLRIDFLHAWRAIRARPGATIGLLLVVALGIGLATTIFALADPFVGRPLPYATSRQLAIITPAPTRAAPVGGARAATVADLQVRCRDLFSDVAAYRLATGGLRVLLGTQASYLRTAQVTPNFFVLLGVPVSQGGSSVQARRGGTDETILTAAAYRRFFGERESPASRTVPRQGGGAITIAGALPRNFIFPWDAPVFPIDAVTFAATGEFGVDTSIMIGRLKPGITPTMAAVALRASVPGRRFEVRSIREYMTRRTRPVAVGALAAGLLVLFVCAGNVANLLLTRGAYRSGELAMRQILGASRVDVVRLVLIEISAVSVAAIVAALLLTALALAVSQRILPLEYAALGQPAVTGRVVLFAWAAGTVVVVIGLLPAWAVWRTAWRVSSAPVSTETPRMRLLRRVATAGEGALAMVLLVGAAFLARSYANLVRQDTGFSANVLVVTALYPDQYSGPPLQEHIDRTVQRLQALAGVQAAAAAIGPMVDRVLMFGGVAVRGEIVAVTPKSVTSDYFAAIGARFVVGRNLDRRDAHQAGVVVNDSFARRQWPNEAALGQMIGGQQASQVVGVVRDTFDVSLDRRPQPTVFWLLDDPGGCSGDCNRVSYVLRIGEGWRAVADRAPRLVSALNPEAAVLQVTSLDDRLAASVSERTFAAFVLILFAVAGLAVSAAGLVGIVAFVVNRRTREIAIRVALGASPLKVLAFVATEAVSATVAGVAVGALAGRWLSNTFVHLLYGVQPGDLFTLTLAGVVMLAVALAASLIPALRALRISPTSALKAE
jgi:predicted permease